MEATPVVAEIALASGSGANSETRLGGDCPNCSQRDLAGR
jgi:hypothetical protein